MKVLIPVDNSECSQEAVRFVTTCKWPAEAVFRVINVIEPLHLDFGIPSPYTAYMDQAEKEMIEHCRQLVTEYADRISKETGCPAEHAVIGGLVASTILDDAKDWHADLVVLGSHGRRGFQKLFLGSVAERVACLAPCSVQIVKPKAARQEEFDSSAEKATTGSKQV